MGGRLELPHVGHDRERTAHASGAVESGVQGPIRLRLETQTARGSRDHPWADLDLGRGGGGHHG
eukprot:10688344-Alexandrium_andersonii.AAC.1